MITSNVINRVFQVLYNEASGTCFTIDVDGRQYIISARHIFQNIPNVSRIQIFHENQWKWINVSLVGHCANDIDVTILTTDLQLSPTFPLEPSIEGIFYGQDVYFIGFPYGMTVDVGELNRDFPLPFVKKAVLSNMHLEQNGTNILFLDGHNNPGFSGGPVVYRNPPNSIEVFKVAAVVSGYRYAEEPIYNGEQPLPLALRYNTGIVICYSIRHAIDLIATNPVGYVLPPDS